jgi:site-specific DNA-methyltransferase (adenine-specific)
VPDLPLNQVVAGDCIEVLSRWPERSVDLVFADPPYNLQLQGDLLRPNQSVVDAVTDDWDRFASLAEYDEFTRRWLSACRRVLKDDGTIWVIGSYHNIFRVGTILMDLGYWILNDVIWHKTNPMPNFRGARFTNATETLIWAQKSPSSRRRTFNYHALKNLNGGKQMQNVWRLPVCRGAERLTVDGRKAHSTQKPEALLYRVIVASSEPGDVVLDPFFGTGTTGAVAKRLRRGYVGVELDPAYVEIARTRLAAIPALDEATEPLLATPSRRSLPRVGFNRLVEEGYLQVGQRLYSHDRAHVAQVRADSHLVCGEFSGSIHQVAARVQGRTGGNGWDFWYAADQSGTLVSIDELRSRYRRDHDLA